MFQKGVGHIEAIISFVLFIGFVFTALYFFAPTGNTNLIDSTLNYALSSISENISVDLLVYSIKINTENVPPSNNGVVAIEFVPEIAIIPANYKVRAENYSGSVRAATRVNNVVYVKLLSGEKFIVLKFSEDILSGTQVSERPVIQATQYQISSSSTRKILSEKRAKELNKSYYASYDSVKTELDMPPQSSFGFGIQLPEYIISVPTQIPQGSEVFSTITRRELLLLNGDNAYGELSVKVW